MSYTVSLEAVDKKFEQRYRAELYDKDEDAEVQDAFPVGLPDIKEFEHLIGHRCWVVLQFKPGKIVEHVRKGRNSLTNFHPERHRFLVNVETTDEQERHD